MDPENRIIQVKNDLEKISELIKDEYINEDYSDVKVEEHPIDITLEMIKSEYINDCDTEVKIEDLFIGEEDSCHSRDNEEDFGDNHIKDVEPSNTHIISSRTHIGQLIYVCNKCNEVFPDGWALLL